MERDSVGRNIHIFGDLRSIKRKKERKKDLTCTSQYIHTKSVTGEFVDLNVKGKAIRR